MVDFAGKTILITGASSGIGLATAEAFAEAGARVITAQRRKSETHETITADLMDPASAEQVITETISRTGRLDVLVNNAGLMREGTAEEMPLGDWHATLHLNLTVPFLLARHALPHLKETKGAIINVGSIEGLGANPGHPAYCASKAGLHGLTRALAVDHGPDGVRINAVAPGWIDTELNEAFIDSMPDPAAFRQDIGRIHPMRQTGSPDDVARLIRWLASGEARFVTGQIWTIDGGRMAQLSLP